jgi:hypothetical protein
MLAVRFNRERWTLAAHTMLRRAARRAGLDVVRADFNSPIIDSRTLDRSFWDLPGELAGVQLDLEAQLHQIETHLLPFVGELAIPVSAGADRSQLHLDNPWYGPMDAQLLYAMLRHRRPRQVLELGSGFSSLLIDRALARNSTTGPVPVHRVVDPFPSPLLARLGREVTVQAQSAAQVPDDAFDALRAGDVLFIDTSHVVRPGGEVTRVVLGVLSRLAVGVLVHFHDIFMPFPYPRVLYDRYNVHWQEQYLVQAYLAHNSLFEVRLSNHALWRAHPERLKRWFPGLRDGMQPSALWLQRV